MSYGELQEQEYMTDEAVFEQNVLDYVNELAVLVGRQENLTHKEYVEEFFEDTSEALIAWNSGFERAYGVRVGRSTVQPKDILAYLEDRKKQELLDTYDSPDDVKDALDAWKEDQSTDWTKRTVGQTLGIFRSLGAIQYVNRRGSGGTRYDISDYAVDDDQALRTAFHLYWPELSYEDRNDAVAVQEDRA